jgi:predicted nucleic acid-binding protein
MWFVDTNILLYSISTDLAEADKTAIASELLERADLALSVQVLQELYVQATHPRRSDALSGENALALIATWLRYPVQEMTVKLMRSAAICSQRWQISYWDAAVVEAARTLGCNQILTEDLNDRQDFGGVVVVNPFVR